ncbi:MAG: helix-turn-helix domain-containing protein [Desulfovibrionaceae bacterium]
MMTGVVLMMNYIVDDELLNAEQLASLLKLSRTTVQAYRSKKPDSLPPSFKLGRLVRWRKSDVQAWIADIDVGQVPAKRGPGRPRKR